MTSKKPLAILPIRSSSLTRINPIGESDPVAVDEFTPPLPSQKMSRAIHEDETVKQAKDFLMRTHYCSLANAAEITHRTENQLLELGRMGSFVFVTPLPTGIYLNPVNDEKRLWNIPDPEDFPALLVLDGTDCEEIKSNDMYEQGSFEKIISPFSGETVLPLNGESQHGGKWMWRTFVHSSSWFPKAIPLNRDCIFVRNDEYLSELSLGSNGLPSGFISMNLCIALTGLAERTIDYKTKEGQKRYDKNFPLKYQLPKNRIGFMLSEVQIWIDSHPKT